MTPARPCSARQPVLLPPSRLGPATQVSERQGRTPRGRAHPGPAAAQPPPQAAAEQVHFPARPATPWWELAELVALVEAPEPHPQPPTRSGSPLRSPEKLQHSARRPPTTLGLPLEQRWDLRMEPPPWQGPHQQMTPPDGPRPPSRALNPHRETVQAHQ